MQNFFYFVPHRKKIKRKKVPMCENRVVGKFTLNKHVTIKLLLENTNPPDCHTPLQVRKEFFQKNFI